MSEVLRERAAEGVAVIFSSHQLELVERLCDDVAIVNRGRIVAAGAVEELRTERSRRACAWRSTRPPTTGSPASRARSWWAARTAPCSSSWARAPTTSSCSTRPAGPAASGASSRRDRR